MQKRFRGKGIIIAGVSLAVLSFSAGILTAQEDEDKEIRYPTLAPEVREARPAYEVKEGEFSFTLYLTEGYDNNVRLDSLREEDTFSEQDLGLSYEHPLTESVTFSGTDDFSNITYHKFSDESLLSNDLNIGLDIEFSDKLEVRVDYDFEVLRYYQLGEGDYLSHIPGIEFKYRFSEDFYGLLGYNYLDRTFVKRKIRNGGFQLLRKRRKDCRHMSICEIGYFFPKTFLRLKNEYYLNDSNDQYVDYYDYWADMVSLSAVHMFNQRLSGFLSIGHQWKGYKQRTTYLPLLTFTTQEDRLLIGYACLSYDLGEGLSLNIDYSYRENNSNDPEHKYSGSIASGSLTFGF
jgi:hypothetical protein